MRTKILEEYFLMFIFISVIMVFKPRRNGTHQKLSPKTRQEEITWDDPGTDEQPTLGSFRNMVSAQTELRQLWVRLKGRGEVGVL